ncbi:MAG TPA: UDP-N-acetylmuramate dehydrogenase [bacterium]|nr:UDP-N-acetylmuramate dehydrogenase [bacterium]
MSDRVRRFNHLKKCFQGIVLMDEPLSNHTSFRIGGPADYYVYPRNLKDLVKLVDFCHDEQLPRFTIGAGTNLLVSDEGFRGMVIDLSRGFHEIQHRGLIVEAGAGIRLKDVIRYCTERGMSGLENLAGIPGRLGGCLRINAGAWGCEIHDRLQNVQLLDSTGVLEKRDKIEIVSGYRFTNFAEEEILIKAEFILGEDNPVAIERRKESVLRERKAKQPLSLPSAGSVFKRPQGDFAGRLIQEAGCKGLRIGDAMVSKKHANFIVNCRLASARDVLNLIGEVRKAVFRQFGVELELEIHLLGFENT